MNKPADLPLTHVSDEENSNTSNNPSFASVLDARLSRRSLLRGGVGTAATALFGSFGLAACGGGGGDDAPAEKALGFSGRAQEPGRQPEPCPPATPRPSCTPWATR
jgi:hypothetical protein